MGKCENVKMGKLKNVKMSATVYFQYGSASPSPRGVGRGEV